MTGLGLPGLTGIDHVGFTVPDLATAHTFLVEVIGCRYLYSLGPFAHADNWMTEHMNVPPRVIMRQLHFYDCGGQAIFEVFEFEAEDQVRTPPRNSDVGGHHVALYVDDLDVAVAYLRDRGVTVLGEPTVSTGASAGQRWVYFLAPWGMQWELVSYPEGKAYLRDRTRMETAR